MFRDLDEAWQEAYDQDAYAQVASTQDGYAREVPASSTRLHSHVATPRDVLDVNYGEAAADANNYKTTSDFIEEPANFRFNRRSHQARHRFEEDPCDGECEVTGPRWKLHPFALVVVIVVLVSLSGIGLWHNFSGNAVGNTSDAAEGGTAGTSLAAGQSGDDSSGDDSASDTETSAGNTKINSSDTANNKNIIYVYVTGEVANPGLYELREGDRVGDAIESAGNLTGKADASSVNLARVAQDGEHIHVLAKGESPNTAAGSGGSGLGSSSGGSVGGCVNLNYASETELQVLDGIGPALAARIVEFREKNGFFQSVEEVDAVSGIGPALVQRITVGACV